MIRKFHAEIRNKGRTIVNAVVARSRNDASTLSRRQLFKYLHRGAQVTLGGLFLPEHVGASSQLRGDQSQLTSSVAHGSTSLLLSSLLCPSQTSTSVSLRRSISRPRVQISYPLCRSRTSGRLNEGSYSNLRPEYGEKPIVTTAAVHKPREITARYFSRGTCSPSPILSLCDLFRKQSRTHRTQPPCFSLTPSSAPLSDRFVAWSRP